MDNSTTLSYNKDSKTTSYDLNDAWKSEHEKELRYAGDSARESVDKGLKETPKFMKDAPEGTNYSDVQSASVKWSLANDTDNKELKQSAFDELTGLLSTVNKEQYLSKARPLQEFVDAKDTFDYKHKNYTTTKNANKEFSVTTYDLQQFLNKEGYTDKFGNPLKEDGIMGAKTQHAHDQMLEAENNSTANTTEQPDKPAEPTSAQTYTQPVAPAAQPDAPVPAPAQVVEPTQPAETTNNLKNALARYHESDIASRGISSVDSNKVGSNFTVDSAIDFSGKRVFKNTGFDYDTRLSYRQEYDPNVEVLQNRLVQLGYLDMTEGGWGYYGPKTIEAVNKYKKDNGLGNNGKDEGVVGKDTWSSLGLVYRTQKDIDAEVEIITIGREQYKDVSKTINNALRRDRKIFEENANDLLWFFYEVCDSGRWNIKQSKDVWEQTIGSSFPGYSTTMVLFGHYVTVEDIGNITYGYLGKAAQLSNVVLYNGSSTHDLFSHGLNNLRGEAADQYWIQVGIDWYNSTIR